MFLVLLQILNVVVTGVVSAPTVYDQRQTGKSNIRIDVRDAILIAVADEFGDYDYTYDYSDLTIKPELPSATAGPPPMKPPAMSNSSSTTLETPHVIHNSTLVLDADNSTLTFVSGNAPGNETVPETAGNGTRPTRPGDEYQIPVIVVHDGTKENTKLLPVKILEKQAAGGEPTQPRHCSPGFFLDNHNRCKRIRKPVRERHQP